MSCLYFDFVVKKKTFAYFKVPAESILHQLNIIVELLYSPSLLPFCLKGTYPLSSPVFSMTFDKNACFVDFRVTTKSLVMLLVPP